MSIEEYWGTLKAWGLSNAVRVTQRTFTMLDRDGDPCHIPDPAALTPAERDAALDLVKELHLRLGS